MKINLSVLYFPWMYLYIIQCSIIYIYTRMYIMYTDYNYNYGKQLGSYRMLRDYLYIHLLVNVS